MEKINQEEVKQFYEKQKTVWPFDDKWHNYSQKVIHKFLHQFSYEGLNVLNAGSGGNDYGIDIEMMHLDIVESKIQQFSRHLIGTIEDIPCPNHQFDMVICVGSVINYCDAGKSIIELTRVLRPGGSIILEFETSLSTEYKGSLAYMSNVGLVTTQYFDEPHKLWVYSPQYIYSFLQTNKIVLNCIQPFHVVSGLMYGLLKNENIVAHLDMFDPIFRHIPILRNHASNIILFGTKT